MAIEIRGQRDLRIVVSEAESQPVTDRLEISFLDLELRNRSRGGSRVEIPAPSRRGTGHRGTWAREWGEILD